MNYFLSFILAGILGFLCVNPWRDKYRLDPILSVIAGCGIGLALSAHCVFYTLFTAGKFHNMITGMFYAGALILLLGMNIAHFKNKPSLFLPAMPSDKTTWVSLALLSLILIPLIREASFFPFGGWDAWASWNLKAKFIFLGDDQWKNMFDPSMWRSNNQYPFLLPLIISWGWMFYGYPENLVSQATAIILTFMTAVFLWRSLYCCTRNKFSILPVMLLFSIPFINTLNISQYSDILLAFFILSALSFLYLARTQDNPGYALLCGCFCGLMTFTKTEGLVAGVIIALCALACFLKIKTDQGKLDLLWPFLTACLIMAIPTSLFHLFWSSHNVSFINSLVSTTHPTTVLRLKAIFVFLIFELISPKYNGLWILLTAGALLAKIRGFKNYLWIAPFFLILFLGSAFGYYFINTHFEIIWWLQTTLNRVLYTILPSIVWWVFVSLMLDNQMPKHKNSSG